MDSFDSPSIKTQNLLSGFPFIQYKDRFSICGQPSKENLAEFKKENWDFILNLRNPEELGSLDFQMDEACGKLDIKYTLIPVFYEGDIDVTALKGVHKVLNSDSYKKAVIHCASGRRAALALTAHLFYSKQCKLEDLPILANQLGLSSQKLIDRLSELVKSS